ncbi:MAG TPA: hypothetical protein K8V00_10455 [Ligilactobacillus acidipiscis]|uniref:Uncharacterized protein n=1 Tax=Ligilactobacillus acidipiscis TaxID=89059 RepID=A0A921FCP0_9LACO|nr:hypothetical protein [Ligilactobacillus acidipiscis]
MNVKELFTMKTLWCIAFGAVFSFIVPIIGATLDLNDIMKVGFILLGTNVVYSIILGLFVGAKNISWLVLLIFPVLYLIGYRYFFDGYALYFTLVYLGLTYLSYGITED